MINSLPGNPTLSPGVLLADLCPNERDDDDPWEARRELAELRAEANERD